MLRQGENANVNINSGNKNVSFDTRMGAAVSAAAGANAVIQVAKNVAGSPAQVEVWLQQQEYRL